MLARFGSRRLRNGYCFCNSEVRYDCCVTRQQNIFGLDVAVDDAFSVSVMQSPRDVAKNRDDLPNGKRSHLAHARAKRFSADERHRVVRDAVGNSCGQNRDDVRMLERSGDSDFPREPLTAYLGRYIRPQHFHDYLAPESLFAGEEYARHASAAELALYSVGVTECSLKAIAEVQPQALPAGENRLRNYPSDGAGANAS